MKKINNNLLYIILLVFVLAVLIFILFFLKKEDTKTDDITILPDNNIMVDEVVLNGDHLGVNINDILNEENYNKVGINPEKYEKFEDFLIDLSTFENVDIDPINEKFVIGIKKDDGIVSYLPFDFKNDVPNKLDNDIDKNLAILDIYNAYKEDSLYGGADSSSEEKIFFDNDFQHPKTSELNRILNFEVNVNKYLKELSGLEELTYEDSDFLAYLYEFVGEYEKAEEIEKQQCIDFPERCDDSKITLTVAGTVTDISGTPVGGVKIELLNNPDINTISDENGNYKYTFEVSDLSHLRFKSSKLGYSDGFGTYQVNLYDFPSDEYMTFVDFHLYTPNEMVSVSDTNYESFMAGGMYYLIEEENSKYYIPIDGLYFEDDTKYEGHNFDVYMYQFTKWTDMSSLLENDTFEPVYGFVGNIMKTFGMPYIQLFDRDSGKELFIKSSNPMILQNQVYHMKELYEDYDKLYGPVTKEDMEFLYNYSQENKGYPIDFDFLTENDFLRWPARWSLDRKRGVWENVGQRLLDKDGLVELPFYSIKDN